MLHPILAQQFKYSVFRLIYDSKIKADHPDIKRQLQEQVKSIRTNIKLKAGADDNYAVKLKTFGAPGSWAKYKSDELDKVVYNNKIAPAGSLGQWRTIEFEMIFKHPDYRTAFVKWSRGKRYHHYITVKGDGSIKPNHTGEVGAEIVVSFKVGEDQIVRDVCAYLRDKAYVNATCGTHVHFDFRHKSKAQASEIGIKFGKCVPALKTILPRVRRNSEYCARHDVSSENRYSFVNLTAYDKYKTLEIRGHSGTLVATKILNWIKICDIIMAKSFNQDFADINEVARFFEFDEVLTAYVNKRYNEFNKDTKRDNIEDIDSDHLPSVETPKPLETTPQVSVPITPQAEVPVQTTIIEVNP